MAYWKFYHTVDSVNQAQLLLRDLKIAQYTKLSPRAAFTAQISGTLLGSILNYGMEFKFKCSLNRKMTSFGGSLDEQHHRQPTCYPLVCGGH